MAAACACAQVPLKVGGPGWVHGPLTDEILEVAKKTVAGWLTREGIKRDTAKAKNDLEAYIISTRDQLDSRAALQQVGTAAAMCRAVHSCYGMSLPHTVYDGWLLQHTMMHGSCQQALWTTGTISPVLAAMVMLRHVQQAMTECLT